MCVDLVCVSMCGHLRRFVKARGNFVVEDRLVCVDLRLSWREKCSLWFVVAHPNVTWFV